jgi:hypothetical protein
MNIAEIMNIDAVIESIDNVIESESNIAKIYSAVKTKFQLARSRDNKYEKLGHEEIKKLIKDNDKDAIVFLGVHQPDDFRTVCEEIYHNRINEIAKSLDTKGM